MRSVFQYVRPASLDEAIQWLAANASETVVFAGGTDLMPAMRKGEISCSYVLDISRLDELKVIGLENDCLVIGAGVTYTDIVENDVIREQAPTIAAAARCVGSEQIRNVGTLGGNVGNASPAADSIPALMVHNATVEIVRSGVIQTRPLAEIILGPYHTSLMPGDLITKFYLEPLPAPYRTVYQRIGRRRAMAISRINLAAAVLIDSQGAISDFRMCIGSMTPQPYRASSVETMLVGKTPNRTIIVDAARLASQDMIKRSGVRSSTEYKKPAAEGLIIRSLCELFAIDMGEDDKQCEP